MPLGVFSRGREELLLSLVLLAASSSWAQVLTTAPPDAGVPAPQAFSAKVALGKGITVSRGDSLSMTVKGRMSIRELVSVVGPTATNDIELRTVRLVVQGQAFSPSLSYYVQLALGMADFETLTDKTGKQTLVGNPMFDAYIDFTALRDLQLRVGQFLVPFDRARTIREFSLQFVDRQQIVSELTLDRDIGLMAFSNDLFGWGGRLGYAAAVFGGQGRNRVVAVANPVFMWTGRLSLRPMGPFDDDSEGDIARSTSPHLAIGLAGAYNGGTWRQRSTTGMLFLLPGGFKYTNLAADVVFKYGGFALLAEGLYRQADRDSRSGTKDVNDKPIKDLTGTAITNPITEFSRSGWGYTVQASLMVTKELELVARWNQLRWLGATDPDLISTITRQGREATIGFNVYLNGHLFKVQADYTARFSEGATLPYAHLVMALLDLSL